MKRKPLSLRDRLAIAAVAFNAISQWLREVLHVSKRKPLPNFPQCLHGNGFCYWCQSMTNEQCSEAQARTCPNGAYEKSLGVELPKDRLKP